jgi:ABC-type bacteriocin/lantibiotic exporter with double-glycine peptidase domain
MFKNSLMQIYKQLKTILSKEELKAYRKLNTIALVGVFVDAVSLVMILPILSILMTKEAVNMHRYWGKIYSWLGFTGQHKFLFLMVVLLLALFIIKNMIGLYIANKQSKFAHQVAGNISSRNFIYFFSQNLKYIKNAETANLITQIMFVPSAFASGILLPLCTFISELLVLLIIVVGLAIFKPYLFILIGITLAPFFGLIYQALKKKMYRLGKIRNEQSTASYDKLSEAFSLFIEGRMASKEQFLFHKYIGFQRSVNDADATLYTYSAIPSRLIEIAAISGVLIILAFAMFSNMAEPKILYLMGVFTAATFRIIPSINRITYSLLKLKNYQYTIDVLTNISTTQQPLQQSFSTNQTEALAFKKEIKLSRISFGFDDVEGRLLRDLNIFIEKGTIVGIKGDSGIGKSTLLYILCGLIQPDEGTIYMDDVALSKDQISAYQQLIGLVSQDAQILNGSLEENIYFGDPEPDHVRAQQLIEQLKLTVLQNESLLINERRSGEKGSKLSGGQKQRMAIARALYRNPQLLIMDEATSHIDKETENDIMQIVSTLRAEQQLTVIIISHHNETLKRCDKVYELNNGYLSPIYISNHAEETI